VQPEIAISSRPAASRSPNPAKQIKFNLPVVFEPNLGQASPWIRYVARSREGEIALGSDRIEIARSQAEMGEHLELSFVGANAAEFQPEDTKGGFANYYFGGKNPRRVERVPMYGRIRYARIYPGTDLVFHGRDGRLEYDFELGAGASASTAQIGINDTARVLKQGDGSLVIESGGNRIQLLAPRAFQKYADKNITVEVSYFELDSHRIGFKLGSYDHSKPLTIDPVVTYAGAFQVDNSTSVSAAAVDASGDVIITGSTFAINYPVIDGEPIGQGASEDVFVTKFDPAGENILYSTYLPAAGFNSSRAIAVDANGNAFVAGITSDPNFPLTSHNLGACSSTFCNAGFITKLDPSGVMLYSTLLGWGQILPVALTTDADGNAVVAGLAADGSMQTVNAYQPAYLGGLCTSCNSAFFAKLNATGNGFIFSSYLGAQNGAGGVALDAVGNIYVAGTFGVYTPMIPLKGELQSGSGGFFLNKFSPDGQTLLFGTMFGGYAFGEDPETLAGVAVGSDGTVYAGGSTYSDGFPYTLNAYRHPIDASLSPRMFAIAFDPSLQSLKYSTDLGAGFMNAMTVDAAGNFYAAASTRGEPIEPKNALVADVTAGGFFLELDPTGNPIQTSAYGGHNADEEPVGIAIDSSGNIFLAGTVDVESPPFISGCGILDPILVGENTYGPSSPLSGGCSIEAPTVFVSKIAPSSQPQISLGQTLPFLFLHNVGTADLHISDIAFSGGIAKAGGTCGKTVPAGTTCILTLTDANGNTAQGSVTITSDASPEVQTFTPYLSPQQVGSSAGDLLYADVSQLYFPPQYAGTTSPNHPLQLWNAGVTNLTLNSISAGPYLSQTNNCPGTLAPGAGCTVQVAFNTNSTYQNDSITITTDNNGVGQSYYVYSPFLASPTPVLLSQTNPIPFGNETQGHAALYRTVTMTNVSNSAVAPPSFSVSGDSALSIEGNTCSGSLAPQQSCVVAVAMSSATIGQHTATLSFSGTASASFEVWGNVIPSQAITPSANQLKWAPLVVGETATKDLTLTNSSSGAASVLGFSFTTTDYSETDDCTGSALAGGASCVVHVTFSPAAAGAADDSMTINLGSTTIPLTIALSGQGQYEIGLSPAVIDFGSGNIVASSSTPQSVTAANEANAAVGYTLAVTGPFSVNNQCPNPLPALATCTLSVVYKPTVDESDSGSLILTASGLTTGNSVSLYGSGASAAVMSVPVTLNAGSVAVGKSSSAVLALENTGEQTYSGVSFSFSGANAGDFSVPSNLCSSVAGRASCSVGIGFAPSAAGNREAMLTIKSTASNSPQQVFLSGTGTPGTPSIVWATPSQIVYGTALGNTQLDATASVSGNFTYSPAAGTILSTGIQTLQVTFTPTDTTDYTSATQTAQLTVSPAPLTVTANNQSMTYGGTVPVLTGSLTGVITGDGINASFETAATSNSPAGQYPIVATLNDPNSKLGNYTVSNTPGTLTVGKVAPTVTWATPAAITYGTALSATQLNASSPVAGVFAYTPPAGTLLSAGAQSLTVAFNPTNTIDYTTAAETVQLTVNRATPVVAEDLSATSITTAQPLTVTFSVGGATTGKAPTGSVTLTGGGYTSAATSITSGSATINIPAGSLAPGNDALVVTFTPDVPGAVNYNIATQSATVTVTAAIGTAMATMTVTPSVATITNAQSLSVTIALAGGSGQSTPTGPVTLASGSYSAQQELSSGSVSFDIPAGALSAGANTLTATYSGDATYAKATGTATITVSQVIVTISSPTSVSPGGSTSATATFTAGSTYSGTLDMTCALGNSPTGAQSLPTCSLNPANIAIAAGGSGTSTLTINTTAASNSALARPLPRNLWDVGGGGALLAVLVLFGVPSRRRHWALMFVLVALALGGCAIGCGGSGGQSTGPGTPATTAGNYTFSVTGTDSANPKITVSTNVKVVVQ
jgi:hypothetical protein